MFMNLVFSYFICTLNRPVLFKKNIFRTPAYLYEPMRGKCSYIHSRLLFRKVTIQNIEELARLSLFSFNVAVLWTNSPTFNFCIKLEKKIETVL